MSYKAWRCWQLKQIVFQLKNKSLCYWDRLWVSVPFLCTVAPGIWVLRVVHLWAQGQSSAKLTSHHFIVGRQVIICSYPQESAKFPKQFFWGYKCFSFFLPPLLSFPLCIPSLLRSPTPPSPPSAVLKLSDQVFMNPYWNEKIRSWWAVVLISIAHQIQGAC